MRKSDITIGELEAIGKRAKVDLFEKFAVIREGHPGSVLSIFELVNAIYSAKYINLERKPKHDTFVMSKGHAAAAQYPFLVKAGLIPDYEWDDWGKKEKSCLRIFGNQDIPGIDVTSGSLGHGLGVSAGLALADRMDGIESRHFVVMSEGELYEGSTWEALLFIAHQNLRSVHVVLDVNRNMILGRPEELLGLDPIDQKLSSFGFQTMRIDGHVYSEILPGLDFLCDRSHSPKVLIADTVKGKGVSFLEDKSESHYWGEFSKKQIEQMLEELSR